MAQGRPVLFKLRGLKASSKSSTGPSAYDSPGSPKHENFIRIPEFRPMAVFFHRFQFQIHMDVQSLANHG